MTAALLGTFAAARLGDIGAQRADLWAHISKAYAVDNAVAVVEELVPVTGAAGFTAALSCIK